MTGIVPLQDAPSPASIAFYPPLPSPESQADLQAWADIAQSMGEPTLLPEEITAAIKEKIWNKYTAPLEDEEVLPGSIQAIKKASPSLEYLQYLIRWKRARDILVISLVISCHFRLPSDNWDKLKTLVQLMLKASAAVKDIIEIADLILKVARDIENSPIQKLNLEGKKITHLPLELVTFHTQLKELNVGNNQSFSPEQMNRFSHLVELYLQHNYLSAFPKGMGQFFQLRVLELTCNRFAFFPDEICQLTQLTRLSLLSNRITSLAQAVTQLKQLKDLSLGCNPLGSFPEPVCELPELVLLDLGCTDLPSVPPKVSQLQNLVKFYLNYNNLNTLPNEITLLSRLELLKLEGNFLSSLPDAIVAFTEKKR